jgi:spore coat polysaccharide biosynthesis predicted glycosyltransferase SpsG
MIEADLAVSAAGSTCWELAWSGVPTVAIPIADNQNRLAEVLASTGAAVSLDPRSRELQRDLSHTIAELVATPERRQEMAEVGRSLVDGLGTERVVTAMMDEI